MTLMKNRKYSNSKIDSRRDCARISRITRINSRADCKANSQTCCSANATIRSRVAILISKIDSTVNHQLNAILHHPDFQALESTWRGLAMLVNQAHSNKHAIVKFLDLSYNEVKRDLLNAIEFDQSQLFKKIYSNEYDHAGGEPFGLLVGDYYFLNHPQDIDTLSAFMKIAASAFAPFIASIHPSMFGVDQFSELRSTLEYEHLFSQVHYQRWQSIRTEDDARFVALTLPRILMRLPYNQYGRKTTNRFFQETTENINSYLWGNTAFAYGVVVLKTFVQSGWLADIRGINPENATGGAINTLPRNYFETDRVGIAPKISTDIKITDRQEKYFSDLGFLPLQDNPTLNAAIFYSSQSIQKSTTYNHSSATHNARISSMLHYILCASRFAHYIKVMMRDKVGHFISTNECENYLQNWLLQYCAASQNISAEAKARYPLNEAKVKICEQKGTPGKYRCVVHLKPHYQLDEIHSQLRLVTNLNF